MLFLPRTHALQGVISTVRLTCSVRRRYPTVQTVVLTEQNPSSANFENKRSAVEHWFTHSIVWTNSDTERSVDACAEWSEVQKVVSVWSVDHIKCAQSERAWTVMVADCSPTCSV